MKTGEKKQGDLKSHSKTNCVIMEGDTASSSSEEVPDVVNETMNKVLPEEKVNEEEQSVMEDEEEFRDVLCANRANLTSKRFRTGTKVLFVETIARRCVFKLYDDFLRSLLPLFFRGNPQSCPFEGDVVRLVQGGALVSLHASSCLPQVHPVDEAELNGGAPVFLSDRDLARLEIVSDSEQEIRQRIEDIKQAMTIQPGDLVSLKKKRLSGPVQLMEAHRVVLSLDEPLKKSVFVGGIGLQFAAIDLDVHTVQTQKKEVSKIQLKHSHCYSRLFWSKDFTKIIGVIVDEPNRSILAELVDPSLVVPQQ